MFLKFTERATGHQFELNATEISGIFSREAKSGEMIRTVLFKNPLNLHWVSDRPVAQIDVEIS